MIVLAIKNKEIVNTIKKGIYFAPLLSSPLAINPIIKLPKIDVVIN